MKWWEVTAEINMDASRYATVKVRANTERKAKIFAEEKMKREGAFFVANMTVKELPDPLS